MNLFDIAVAKKLAGGGGGGGGSSDFSTATISVTRTFLISYMDNCPNIVDEEGFACIQPTFNFELGETTTCTVPLYKGMCVWDIIDENVSSVSASGNAEVYGARIYITGDCTITIS